MKFQNVIEIKAPVTEVFEFVADMRNTPKWNYFVMRVIPRPKTILPANIRLILCVGTAILVPY